MRFSPDMNNPLTAPFWTAARNQRLEIPFCTRCENYIWYPRAACPHCDQAPEWRLVSGRGSIAAFTIVRRPLFPAYGEWTPYITALVAIEEDPGVRVVTRIVDCDPQDVKCDMSVAVSFRPLQLAGEEPFIAPLFVPTG